jgi:hypothetical protein
MFLLPRMNGRRERDLRATHDHSGLYMLPPLVGLFAVIQMIDFQQQMLLLFN